MSSFSRILTILDTSFSDKRKGLLSWSFSFLAAETAASKSIVFLGSVRVITLSSIGLYGMPPTRIPSTIESNKRNALAIFNSTSIGVDSLFSGSGKCPATIDQMFSGTSYLSSSGVSSFPAICLTI